MILSYHRTALACDYMGYQKSFCDTEKKGSPGPGLLVRRKLTENSSFSGFPNNGYILPCQDFFKFSTILDIKKSLFLRLLITLPATRSDFDIISK